MNIVYFILIGAIAGWLSGKIIRGSGFGAMGNIIVGILGGIIGGWVFGKLGVATGGGITGIVGHLGDWCSDIGVPAFFPFKKIGNNIHCLILRNTYYVLRIKTNYTLQIFAEYILRITN